MTTLHNLVARSQGSSLNSTQIALLTSLLIIVILGVLLVGALFVLRRMRRARKAAEAQLPLYEKRRSTQSGLTITATPRNGRNSVLVYSEKESLMRSSLDSPTSSVPEIRITFPDEVDESGKRQSGRVVVVRVGDHSVGLEPLQEDLPAYERDASSRFDSLDLDRIGGLKEKGEKEYS